jgi:hypothetical protein
MRRGRRVHRRLLRLAAQLKTAREPINPEKGVSVRLRLPAIRYLAAWQVSSASVFGGESRHLSRNEDVKSYIETLKLRHLGILTKGRLIYS